MWNRRACAYTHAARILHAPLRSLRARTLTLRAFCTHAPFPRAQREDLGFTVGLPQFCAMFLDALATGARLEGKDATDGSDDGASLRLEYTCTAAPACAPIAAESASVDASASASSSSSFSLPSPETMFAEFAMRRVSGKSGVKPEVAALLFLLPTASSFVGGSLRSSVAASPVVGPAAAVAGSAGRLSRSASRSPVARQPLAGHGERGLARSQQLIRGLANVPPRKKSRRGAVVVHVGIGGDGDGTAR